MTSTQEAGGVSASSWAMNQILDLIRGDTLGPGDRLPAERDLGTRLGVSRGSVREAISALVTLGVLESRHGAGVFVTSLKPAAVLPRLGQAITLVADRYPAEVARLHAQIEGGAAARAAARATPESLAPLAQALADLRLAVGEPAPREPRDRFRSSIARLSDDRFHRAITGLAEDPVAEGMVVLLRASRDVAAGVDQLDMALHEKLVRAIADREPDEARTLAEVLVRSEFLRTHGQPTAMPPPPAHPGGGAPDNDTDDGGDLEPAPSRERRPRADGTAPAETDVAAPPGDVPAWFRDAKFGLIVHWGVYSVPGWAPVSDAATDFAEWYQLAAADPDSLTAAYHERVHGGRPYRDFRPAFEEAVARWSPDAWAADFQRWGARYLVQIVKHHDGFLLWPSRVRHPRDQTWHTTRDVVGELAGAARARGMRFGVFYSSGVDWSFAEQPPAQASDVQTSNPAGVEYARYVEAHWRELIEAYRPDGLWNDTGYPAAGDARTLLGAYRAQVPDGVVTERFRTSAAGIAPAGPRGGPWESVRPLGLSFGWNRQEDADHVLTGATLLCTLLDVVARNGNLLLGVSPDDHGQIPELQRRSLDELGRWLERHGAAVYETRPWGPRSVTSVCGRSVWFTRRTDALYVSIEAGAGDVEIAELDPPTGPLTHLVDGDVVAHRPGPRGGTVISMPAVRLDDGPVVVLRLDPPPAAAPPAAAPPAPTPTSRKITAPTTARKITT